MDLDESHGPKKKRQHYVPRLLLRRFSSDERRVSVVILSTGKRIDSVGLKEQCAESYFYGEDGVLEKGFEAGERRFSEVVGDLGAARLAALTTADLFQIKLFVHYQRLRTAGAAEQMDQLTAKTAKELMPRGPSFERLPDFDGIRVRLTNAPQFLFAQATMLTPVLVDLAVKFLISDHSLGLVLSDDPVIVCNQYAEHHPVLGPPCSPGGTTGLAMKGLQLFLPVSPRVCIAVFDPGTYEYGSPTNSLVRLGLGDVRLLNTMQVANAAKCIYFDKRAGTDSEVRRLIEARRKFTDWRTPHVTATPFTPRGDGTYSNFLLHEIPDLRVGKRLSCVKVIRSEADNLGHLPPRSPELLSAPEDFERFLRAKAAAGCIQAIHEAAVSPREPR